MAASIKLHDDVQGIVWTSILILSPILLLTATISATPSHTLLTTLGIFATRAVDSSAWIFPDRFIGARSMSRNRRTAKRKSPAWEFRGEAICRGVYNRN